MATRVRGATGAPAAAPPTSPGGAPALAPALAPAPAAIAAPPPLAATSLWWCSGARK
eukprot:CAMPEP_0183342886 /NCGR_PEP_ID=MMETSP0164_2-20130417/8907_1 /TAXON_ID=221442 /ORGANISM="Coccolithus pelagicus ssp braarudi, Strain PLY182g" /LENGTH=56 /DNA_ID=CAMNT_0025513597 /DNA_START=246 /DNA_END=416 /DNA_ORIENTATION=+